MHAAKDDGDIYKLGVMHASMSHAAATVIAASRVECTLLVSSAAPAVDLVGGGEYCK